MKAIEAARLLAVFASPERAEQALADLRRSGVDPARLSVLASEARPDIRLCSGHAARLALALAGAAFVRLPGVGRVLALGAIAAACSATPDALLTRAGVSTGEAQAYEAALRGR